MEHVSVKETCALDSVIHLIIHAIAKNYQYKERVQNSDHFVVKLAIRIFRGKFIASNYKTRAKILYF